MRFIDLTLASPASNIAYDEVLLNLSEDGSHQETLRIWESPVHFVTLGSSNRAAVEVNLERCAADRVPVIRRRSGGGAVLQGPGCLNYCLVVKIRDAFSTISGTNNLVLGRHRDLLRDLTGADVAIEGISDLTVDGLKFSGNAQRRRLRYLMIHGTFLLDFDIALIGKYLSMPSKEPAYRAGRHHSEFLTNLGIRSAELREELRHAWGARERTGPDVGDTLERLVRERYGTDEWNLRM